jgi:hypothetical protein
MGIYNAGCSTSLGRFRVFSHVMGTLVGEPLWLDAAPTTAPARYAAAAME